MASRNKLLRKKPTSARQEGGRGGERPKLQQEEINSINTCSEEVSGLTFLLKEKAQH